jgi:DNA repair protein RecO (recombination protein O)
LLDELGFGLDLSKCAATGVTEDLAYVSPKSGKAVCRESGSPYASRLFNLPGFLAGGSQVLKDDVAEGLRLTGYFIERHLLGPRQIDMPQQRAFLQDWFVKAQSVAA